jgi:hypothetical protein
MVKPLEFGRQAPRTMVCDPSPGRKKLTEQASPVLPLMRSTTRTTVFIPAGMCNREQVEKDIICDLRERAKNIGQELGDVEIVVGKQQVQFDAKPFVNCDGC